MYAAKDAGRGRFQVFRPGLAKQVGFDDVESAVA
jgi:hypothetical protein